MKSHSSNEFPNGVIDLFKQHRIFDLNILNCERKGDVTCVMNQEIGRKVIQIQGTLGPINCLKIPNIKQFNQGLFYYSNYYYVFFQSFINKTFSFQFNFICNEIYTLRLIFKYPLNGIKFSKTSSYNLEIPVKLNEKKSGIWSLLRFSPREIIEDNLNDYSELSAFQDIAEEDLLLKSFEANASINLRGVYASNYRFDLDSLPKEMFIKTINNQISVPLLLFDKGELIDSLGLEEGKQNKENNKENIYNKNNGKSIISNKEKFGKNDKNKNNKNNKNENNKSDSDSEVLIDYMDTLKNKEIKYIPPKESNNKDINKELLMEKMKMLNMEYMEQRKEDIKKMTKKDSDNKGKMQPDPIIDLNYIIGYSALTCPNVCYGSSLDCIAETALCQNSNDSSNNINNRLPKKYIYFAAGTTLVKFDPENLTQSFFFGHSKPITYFCLACKGEIIFSNQEGANSIIRVWRTETCECIKMISTPFNKLICMGENRDSQFLVTAGNESNKITIIIYNISDLDRIKVFIKQTIPFSINMISFSPFENIILASCGRENIKFWRIRNDHLSGKAVVLNQYARSTVFLCLSFLSSVFGDVPGSRGRLLAGTDNGCVFSVSLGNQELEAVYRVHNGAILALRACDAFVAVGSADGLLRLWPVDFSEFLLEAKHDSGVGSVEISFDAVEVLCGTQGGSIGVLNVQNKEYKTVLRSPPGMISSLYPHPSGSFLFSLEDNRVVRVWDIIRRAEAFQFSSAGDAPTTLAAPKDLTFAVGFESGALKVFDLDKTEILFECRPFQRAIKKMGYIQGEKRLVVVSEGGAISVHERENNYIQIKIIKIDQDSIYTDLSISIDGDYFATIGSESNCCLVWNALTFGMKNRVPVSNYLIKTICLLNKSLLVTILENCSARFFALQNREGTLIREIQSFHQNAVNVLMSTKNFRYLVSAGDDGLIKVWDNKSIYRNIKIFQQFLGHAESVKGLILIENKALLVSAGENSGLYFWNFLGDITFVESETAQFLENLNDPEYILSLIHKGLLAGNGGKSINTKNRANLTKNIRNSRMEKEYMCENIGEEQKDNKKEYNNNEMRALPVTYDEKGEMNISIGGDIQNMGKVIQGKEVNIKSSLLFSPTYLPPKTQIQVPEPLIKHIYLDFCFGLSTNSRQNLVLCRPLGWFAFSVNNKVIIEFLESKRRTKILIPSKDEISCISISKDGKVMAIGIGKSNREEYAGIFIYETEKFTEIKRLNFHFKGVQSLYLNSNGSKLISLGIQEENSLCLWDTFEGSVIGSSILSSPHFKVLFSDEENFILAAGCDEISFIHPGIGGNSLEGGEIDILKISDICEDNEYICGIEMSQYFSELKSTYILIGTNKGNLIILEKESKKIILKINISKFPITQIFFKGEYFMCAGEGPIVYTWKFNVASYNGNLFGFLENEKPFLLFLDSAILSLSVSSEGSSGLLTTEFGSIYYIDLLEKASLKIISAHSSANCNIVSIDTDKQGKNLVSCAEDKSIRIWTSSSYDQKCIMQKIGQTPSQIQIYPQQNILLILFSNSYIATYNLVSLNCLGKISIPNENIECFQIVRQGNGICVMTTSGKIYFLEIKSWGRLSVLYCQLEINPDDIPDKQKCKNIACKDLCPDKSYISFSFSDSSISTFLLKKSENQNSFEKIDRYSMIEHRLNSSPEPKIQKIYESLKTQKCDFCSCCCFSRKFEGVLLSTHETLQFLYIRNFNANEYFKVLPLTYFPLCFDISLNESHIAIGTKEGAVLILEKTGESYTGGVSVDGFEGSFGGVNVIKFSRDCKRIYAGSVNEILVWKLNE